MTMQQIERRLFLKSAGVLLALPALESLGRAADKPPAVPKRMVFICAKLGLYGQALFPKQSGQLTAETEYLKLLKDHLADMTLFSGLSHHDQSGRLSHSSEATWLTAARNPGLDGFRNTISVDQLAANRIGYVTRYSSIVLSTEGESSQSYTGNGVMVPADPSPARLFSKLFLKGKPREVLRQKQKLKFDRSILDGLVAETKVLMAKANGADRQRLTAYLESIRKTERDLVRQGEWLDKPVPQVRREKPADVRNKADIVGRTRLMMEMIPLILQTDSSRVINLGIQVDHGVLKLKGVNQEHHSLSHHGRDAGKIRQLKLVESAILGCFSDLLTNMKQKESDGRTLLDHTSVLLGSNLGNANKHDYRNLPIILAGGGFQHGKYAAFDRSKNRPLCNLFLRMLQQSGFEAETFGQSTGTLDWQPSAKIR